MKYRTRSGKTIQIKTRQERFLHILYDTLPGRMAVKLMTKPFLSVVAGKVLNSQLSSLLIDPFIKQNNINMRDYIPCRYRSYNDFFKRKILTERRPVNKSKNSFISPSDGKVTVFPISEQQIFHIKNTKYTIGSLLQCEELAKEYAGGVCILVRLSVDNYHRYCYVDDGLKGINHEIKGYFHTVNPVAVEKIPVYQENSRSYCLIMTENFGKVIQMEVGAMIVGKICNHHEKAKVTRGQEKGYFEFGGSSILLLVKKDQIVIDPDISHNSEYGYETLVRMGEQIAYKTSKE